MIQAYVDNELSASDRVILEEHMSNCSDCEALLRRHRRLCAGLYEAFADKRLRVDLRRSVLEHLPEMEPRSKDLADVNWRAKHSPPTRAAARYLPAAAFAIVAILGFANYYYWPDSPASGDVVGQIAQTVGGSEQLASHGSDWASALRDGVVRANQRFHTETGGLLMLTLQGSTVVKLNQNTELRVHNNRWLTLDKGQVWLDIGRDGSQFKVDTPDGSIVVLGTAFEVSVGAGGTTVAVERGKVRVENSATSTLLERGQQVSLDSKGTLSETKSIDPANLSVWAEALRSAVQTERVAAETYDGAAGTAELAAKEMFIIEQPSGPRNWAFTAINVYWQPDAHREGHCSYEVFVYDDQMQPLFIEKIPGSAFDAAGQTTIAIPVPGGPVVGVRQLMVRLVPNFGTGRIQPKNISVSGVVQTFSVSGGPE